MVPAALAARAYAAIQNQGVAALPPAATEPAGPSFSEVLKGAVGDALASSRAAETQMTRHAAGKGDLVSVVTSVASAQASLETVMAVRDQVISAYQEIMRMPI